MTKFYGIIKKGYTGAYLTGIGALFISIMFSYASPLVMKAVVDHITASPDDQLPVWLYVLVQRSLQNASPVLFLCLIMLSMTAVSGCFSFLSHWAVAWASENILRDMKDRLYYHLQRLPVLFFSGQDSGDLFQRCSSDTETVRKFLVNQVLEVGRAVFMVFMAFPVLWTLHKKLALAALLVVPAILIFSWFFFKKIGPSFEIMDESEAELSAHIKESVTGIRVIRAFGRQKYELTRLTEKSGQYRQNGLNLLSLLAWFWSVGDLLSLSQLSLILGYGSILVLDGSLTVGSLLVFMTYEMMFLWPVRHLGRILADLGKSRVAWKRIRYILDTPAEEYSGHSLPESPSVLELRNVSYSYGSSPLLKNISLTVKAGETVALVGPTGCGKSTLLSLLVRFISPGEGTVLLNGTDVETLSLESVRKNVCLVPQEPYLFGRSIKDNLKLAAGGGMASSRIIKAAEDAAIHGVIESFHDGYDTMVGERGVTLSGGQKQRLAIARALLSQASFLILDDSLSALDSETDRQVRLALEHRNSRQALIIVSHRLNTLSSADRIYVMDRGRIAEEGSHSELLGLKGHYSRLWDLQSSVRVETGENNET